MKYVSIDLETTGLNENQDSILEFGAIIEDTAKQLPYEELPKFHALCVQKRIEGEPFALAMNSKVLQEICDQTKAAEFQYAVRRQFEQKADAPDGGGEPLISPLPQPYYLTPGNLLEYFARFIAANNLQHKPLIGAGKNFAGFDLQFIKRLEGFEYLTKFHYRHIDVGTMYIDWESDEIIPGTEECKRRAGLSDVTVKHRVLADAWDTIQLIRAKV